MSSPAQLQRIDGLVGPAFRLCAHGDDPHLIAVFLAEQRHRAFLDGVIHRHEPRRHLIILQHGRIRQVFDSVHLGIADRLRMSEIES